jgi:hypothetical protein
LTKPEPIFLDDARRWQAIVENEWTLALLDDGWHVLKFHEDLGTIETVATGATAAEAVNRAILGM